MGCCAVLPRAVVVNLHVYSHMQCVAVVLTPGLRALHLTVQRRGILMLWVAVSVLGWNLCVARRRRQDPDTMHRSTQNERVERGPVRHPRYCSALHRKQHDSASTLRGHIKQERAMHTHATGLGCSFVSTECLSVQVYVVVGRTAPQCQQNGDDLGWTYDAFCQWRTAVVGAVHNGAQEWCSKHKGWYVIIQHHSDDGTYSSGPWSRLLLPECNHHRRWKDISEAQRPSDDA